MIIHALIDFDNASQISKIGRSIRPPDLIQLTKLIIGEILKVIRLNNYKPFEINVRFYSGWHDAQTNRMTDNFIMLSSILRNEPRRISGFRINYKIADSILISPENPFVNTVRVRNLRPNLHIEYPNNCIDHANCSLNNVKYWIKNGCPNSSCLVKSNEVFSVREQKTVDISIACDLIYLAQQSSEDRILLVSDDDDFMPALISASSYGGNLTILRRRLVSLYDNTLKSYSIDISTELPDFY